MILDLKRLFRTLIENCMLVPWAGHVAKMEEGRGTFKILTGKPTGKRPLGRPRRRCEDNIRMEIEEKGINAENWVDSVQDRNRIGIIGEPL